MSHLNGKRHTLTLNPRPYPPGGEELFCRQLRQRAEDFRNKKLLAALHKVVYISAGIEPDEPLPAPWNVVPEPFYGLHPYTNQPFVIDGFVWSSFADGTRHRMQHFVGGTDIYGGKALEIWNGTVNMQAPDGSCLVCHYRLGRCISVQTRRAPQERFR